MGIDDFYQIVNFHNLAPLPLAFCFSLRQKRLMKASDINLFVTDSAYKQIQLIKENDYTLAGYEFRLKIGGKGCDGFTYQTGFSQVHADDLQLHIQLPQQRAITILMDPFTAYYVRNARLDYLMNPANHDEGFVIINFDQEKYVGKFFKNGDMVPTQQV